jgi:hypothetical protein
MNDYLLQLPIESLFQKEYIEFMAATVNSSKSKFFNLFHSDSKKINRLMERPGYSENVVDRIIQYEEIDPKLSLSTPTSKLINGQMIEDSAKKNIEEPNWREFFENISEKYNEEYADRALLTAKLKWYDRTKEYEQYFKFYMLRANKYGMDLKNGETSGELNVFAWEKVFLRSVDKDVIDFSIKWMEKNMKESQYWPSYIDTYANLLYKAERKDEAIYWEMKALNDAIEMKDNRNIKDFKRHVELMKANMPTWPSYLSKYSLYNLN